MDDLYDKLMDYVAYAQLWQTLRKTHPYEKISYLKMRMIDIEDEITSHYRIPSTLNYSEIFQNLGLKDDFKLDDIHSFIRQLKQDVKSNFNRPLLSDLQLLKIAKESHDDFRKVVPELALRLHAEPYNSFCYYFLFLPGKITSAQFLKELKLVVKHNCSTELSNLVNKKITNFKNEDGYKNLKKFKLQYLDIFLENYYTFDRANALKIQQHQ